jgi:hypothetical protein
MVNRVLTGLLLPALLLAGAPVVQAEAPVPSEPAWTERRFDARPEAVQAGLAAVMEHAGLSVDPADAAVPDEVVTLWHRFEVEDFGLNVAHDTPTITRDYPYVSPIYLRQGSYRLRARILSRDGGTLLALQVELVADAYNFLEFEAQQVERFSNGIIEDSLYARLEQALDAAPAQD